MAVFSMQIVVSSCVAFFSYITERVPATLHYGWIYLSSLLLCLSSLLLVCCDLSFALAFSKCLCLPLCFISRAFSPSSIALCTSVPALC